MYMWESLSIYGTLKSLRWLIPEVAQPQVPPLKKSEMYYVRFCVCPHTTRLEPKTEQSRRVRGEWLNESGGGVGV